MARAGLFVKMGFGASKGLPERKLFYAAAGIEIHPGKARTSGFKLLETARLVSWPAVCDFLEGVLPGFQKDPPSGREVVRVAGKVLAYLAINERSRPAGLPANEEFVIIRIDMRKRDHLIESNPEAFFVTPHNRTYPGVIVRLSTVDQKQCRDLLVAGWRLVAPRRLVREWDREPSKQPGR